MIATLTDCQSPIMSIIKWVNLDILHLVMLGSDRNLVTTRWLKVIFFLNNITLMNGH